MKIAICLSGHFRLYREIYLNFYKHLYRPCLQRGQTDIFISSWDELNSASSYSHKQGEVAAFHGLFDQNDILQKFPAKGFVFENFDGMKDSFHLHRYDPTVDLSSLHPNIHDDGVLFGLAQFYRRFLCNELKKKYEALSGERYDLVIQARPDVFFLRPFDPLQIDPSKLYERTHYNDNFRVSSSANIDKISEVYLQAQRILLTYKTQTLAGFGPYCPEYFYEHWLNETGFDLSRRAELGEDMMFAYPRQNFSIVIYDILKRHNRLSEWQEVLNYPISQLR